MKAMLIKSYGKPDAFEYDDVEKPKIKDDEILVKVKGSSVNPVDCGIRAGMLKYFIRLNMPAVLGVDVCGEVVEAGKNVTRFKPGDTVYAFNNLKNGGGYGEYAAVNESYAAHTPKNLSLIEAGVVPGVGLTAYEAFFTHTQLQKGQKVLINGAAGGVGTFAVQIAKAMEAHVTGVCSTTKVNLIKNIGADAVIDYKKQDLFSVSEKYDVILDCVRGSNLSKLKKMLNPGGKLLVIAGNPMLIPFQKLISLFSSKKIIPFFVQPVGDNLEKLNDLIIAGKVKPVIEKTYSLQELSEAHRHCETGRVTGKLAIKIIN